MLFDNSTLDTIFVILLIVFFWVYILWTNSRATNKVIQRVAQQQSIIRHDDAVRVFCRAIHLLRPNAHAGTDYIVSEGGPDQGPYIAEWLNSKIPQPKHEEIERALNKTAEVDPAYDHAAQRRKEYPSIGDQLGAAYNARNGDYADQNRLDEQIRLIKEKYPKTKSDEHL
jgi:hypothetical protein